MAPLRSPCSSVRASTGRRATVSVRAITAEKADLDMNKMEPLHDRLLVKPIEEEQMSAGGIVLPSGPPKPNGEAHFATVVSMGEDVDIPIAIGDNIVYQKYAMAEVEVPDGELVFVAQKSILGKME